jgi:hypothetical protein
MGDARYQVFQDGETYKVRITCLGRFAQEADGFSSRADAESWIAQAERLDAIRGEQQPPVISPHLREVRS